MNEGRLQPGDLIVFLGMTGGQRGTCLVVCVNYGFEVTGLRFTYLAAGSRLREYVSNRSEPKWERINERA